MKIVKNTENINENLDKVSDKQAEEAIKTIIKWIGDNPAREGLIETPRRVVKAFKEYFKGYNQEPTTELKKLLGMSRDMMIWFCKKIYLSQVIANIMAPIIGVAHVAYIPNKRIVG